MATAPLPDRAPQPHSDPCPVRPDRTPGGPDRSSILRGHDARNAPATGIRFDVTFSPFAALGAARFRRRNPAGGTRPRHALPRRLLQAAGRADPAPRRAAGADVRLRERRPPDGAVRRDPALSGRHRERPGAGQAGLPGDRGRALLRAPRRRFQGRRARGLAARHHPRQARAGRLDHHPAGGAPVLPQFRIQLFAQAGRDDAGDEDGARAVQGRDLRAVPQQVFLRQSRLRRRRRGRSSTTARSSTSSTSTKWRRWPRSRSSRPAATRSPTRNGPGSGATTTCSRAWPNSVSSPPPKRRRPRRCRCMPARTSARSRSMRPTSRKWCARRWSRASAATC